MKPTKRPNPELYAQWQHGSDLPARSPRLLDSGVGGPTINPLLQRAVPRTFRPRATRPIPANARLEAARMRKRGVFVGTDRRDGRRLYMDPRYLATHLHVLGLTGSGKTRWLGWLFRLLAADPGHTVILIDPKGDLFHLAKRLAVADGLTKRLVLFDLGDPAYRLGFNPLRPNGLPVEIHAKAVRESIRSAWAAEDFFQTPQLARWLYLSLAIARTLELTLVEALQVLTPLSPLRKSVIPKLKDPYLKGSLQYLDKLPERRQDELVAPCLARLEAFVMDSMIRDLLTKQSPALDIAEVIERRQILLVNASKYRPMRKDDCSLLLRMLVNDIVIKAFERPEGKRSPVILIADEVHNLATFDFCQVLDEGRSLGLWTVLAHQFLQQLRDEERSGYLFHSVMADARTKVLFNALPEDVEAMAKTVFLDRWHPWLVKDEMDTLETEFREERRLSRSVGRSGSQGRGVSSTAGSSVADSVAHTQGRSRGVTEGTSEAWSDGLTRSRALSITETDGTSRTRGTNETITEGSSHTEMQSDTVMATRGHTKGSMQGLSNGVSQGEDGGVSQSSDFMAVLPHTVNRSASHSSGSSAVQTAAKSIADSESSSKGTTLTAGDTKSLSHAHGVSESESQSHAMSRGITEALARMTSYTHGVNSSVTDTTSHSTTTGRTNTASNSISESRSEEEGWNEGLTESPFLAPYARRVPSSRSFLTWDEHVLTCVSDVTAEDTGQAVMKFPLHPAAFLDVPWYQEPTLTRKAMARAEERIRANIAGGEVVEGGVLEGEVVSEPATFPMPQLRVSEGVPLVAEDDEDLQPGRFWRERDADA